MRHFLWLCVMLGLQGCGLLLDFDPPDHLPAPDAGLTADSSVSDADSHHADSGPHPDSGRDASLDASDASDDAPDGWDAGPPPPCGGEHGLCLELTETDSVRDTAYWNYDVIYTRPDGTLFGTDWAPYPCVGGIRMVSPGVTQCLVPIPPPSETAVGSPLIYAYPVMDDATPWCSYSTCPGFYLAYRIWIDGTPIPTDPTMSHVLLERRDATPHGTLMCLRIVP